MANDPAVVLVSVTTGATGDTTITEKISGGVATPGTVIGDPLTAVPILGSDQLPTADPANYPVRVKAAVRNTSAERIFRLKFQMYATDGIGDPKDPNVLQNFKLWADTDTPATGCTIYYKVTEDYTTPLFEEEDYDFGDNDYETIPESSPQDCNVSIGGEILPTEGAKLENEDEYTDYVRLLFDIDTTQTSGGTQTLYVSYDEIQ